MLNLLKFIHFLVIITIYNVNAERIGDSMYSTIMGAACFRRLNATHQTGCSSAEGGSTGVLHMIMKPEDFDFILNSPTSPPYAPILTPEFFTRTNLMRLKNAARNISVVILLNKYDEVKNFTHELPCPNQFSGIDGLEASCDVNKPENVWNPLGTGLLHEDFPFPIHFISEETEIQKIVKCFEKYNNFDFDNHAFRSLCSIEVNAFMSAAPNSEICTRRTNFVNNLSPVRYCDPLEGKNIYATLFPRDLTTDREIDVKEKVILVTCRLDSTSMFDEVGLGAKDSISAYGTLLNAAHFLANILPNKTEATAGPSNVFFIIFNGESYDYIGSQRFVFELQAHSFPYLHTKTNPIDIDNIDLMIDLGVLDDFDNLNLYTLKDFSMANTLLGLMKKNSEKQDFKITFNPIKTSNLPPTSAQSFLRESKTFPVVILSSKPSNPYYHSIYDDSVNLLNYMYANKSLDFQKLMTKDEGNGLFNESSVQIKIRNTATVLGSALFEILTGKSYEGKEIVNPVLVDEFLFCFLESQDCPLFKATLRNSKGVILANKPAPRYISVANALKSAAVWTYRIMGLLISQKLPAFQKDNCTVPPMFWFSGYSGNGECRLTTQNMTRARSPAFDIEDYDWKSGKYSTWTESTWNSISARIYLRPSKTRETFTLTIGIVTFVLSFIIVYLIKNGSNTLFGITPTSSTENTISEPAAC